MNGTSWDRDTVLMPVPLRWAQQVADYLAMLDSGTEVAAPTVADGETFVDVPGQGRWTRAMVGELAERTPYQGVKTLLDRCARRATEERREQDRWIPKSDVEQECGISAVQLRNELGALSKLTKRLFSLSTAYWPMEWRKEQGTFFYRMPLDVAKWWLEARGLS